MGIQTILIEGVAYNPLGICNFDDNIDVSHMIWDIREHSIRSDSPQHWELPYTIRLSGTVEMVSGDRIGFYETREMPVDITEAFEKLRRTRLPKAFGRRKKLSALKAKARELLATPRIDALLDDAAAALREKREALVREWQAQLAGIPLVRLELAEGTPLVVMPPLQNLATPEP